MTGSEYYQRRKQPRQNKKYNEYSKEQNNEHYKKTESDEEIDVIPKEASYRQPVHETKSTLQLKNLRSEGSPKIVISSSEVSSIRDGISYDEDYAEFKSRFWVTDDIDFEDKI
jgi:hypothetical protein